MMFCNQYIRSFQSCQAVSNNEKTVFKRAYQLKDIVKVADIPNSVLSDNGGLTEETSATIKSVSDLFKVVKQYYAVRFVIEERANSDSVLVESNVPRKLHAINAKKNRLA